MIFLLHQWKNKIINTHSRVALSSYSWAGFVKLVFLSFPLHTSTPHHHTAAPHSYLVHYSAMSHPSDLDPAVLALGDCRLWHNYDSQIFKSTCELIYESSLHSCS